MDHQFSLGKNPLSRSLVSICTYLVMKLYQYYLNHFRFMESTRTCGVKGMPFLLGNTAFYMLGKVPEQNFSKLRDLYRYNPFCLYYTQWQLNPYGYEKRNSSLRTARFLSIWNMHKKYNQQRQLKFNHTVFAQESCTNQSEFKNVLKLIS